MICNRTGWCTTIIVVALATCCMMISTTYCTAVTPTDEEAAATTRALLTVVDDETHNNFGTGGSLINSSNNLRGRRDNFYERAVAPQQQQRQAVPGQEQESPASSSSSSSTSNEPLEKAFRFNVHTQEFSSSVMDGYANCNELKTHIIIALKELTDHKIDDGMATKCTYYWDDDDDDDDDAIHSPPLPSSPSAGFGSIGNEMASSSNMDASRVDYSNTVGGSNDGTTNSYETNNQVEGVDESDLVKANADYVFIAYSNEIIVTDPDGNILVRAEIPQPDVKGKPEEEDSYYDNGGNTRTIKGLLLDEGNILTVFTEYYNNNDSSDDNNDDSSPLGNTMTTTFIYEYIVVEDKNKDDKDLVLKEQFDTTGSFFTARMMKTDNGMNSGMMNYVVTTTSVDTYKFTQELYRCRKEYRGYSDSEYEQQAYALASTTIESYADKIMNALDFTVTTMGDGDGDADDGGNCKSIVQIFDHNPKQIRDDDDTAVLPDMWFLYQSNPNVLNTFVQITSFNSSAIASSASIAGEEGENTTANATRTSTNNIERNYAGSFLSTSVWDTNIYVSNDILSLSGGGYRRVPVTTAIDDEKMTISSNNNRTSTTGYEAFEYTFLLMFDLNTTTNNTDSGAVPSTAGEVQGYMINGDRGQFSMDYFDHHLRVATSSGQRYGFFPLENGDNIWKELEPAKALISVLQEQKDIGKLVRVGRTDLLGSNIDDNGGTISSVRFLGDRGYVSTYHNGDPLYVLDLSEATNPKKAGELNVTATSLMYLHPIENGTKLLTVGRDVTTNADGNYYSSNSNGLRISVFDVSDSSNPSEEQSYLIETIGSSESLSDHHAFRYIADISMLIIPGYEYSWNKKIFFDGAWLFYIDTSGGGNGITQIEDVVHAGIDEMTNWYCWDPAQLPSRSLMFNGNLMTMQSHSIVMTNTNTLLGSSSNSNATTTTATSTRINLDAGRNEIKNDDCSRYSGSSYSW